MPHKLTFRPYIFRTLILLLLGWGGLVALLLFTEPRLFERWGFFALLTIALSASAFPITYFIATRFEETPPEAYVIVRQAIWVGVFGATLAWLQLARLVTLYVILGLAGGLIAIESVLRLRERARWHVPRVEDHDDEPSA